MKPIPLALAALLLALTGCAPLLLEGATRPASPTVKVPPEHRPPPGKCRIWYPDRPPSRQPPVGECRELRYRVPAGAALVRG